MLYSGTKKVCNDSSGSLKQVNMQNRLLPTNRAQGSQGFPGEQGEHLVFEI